MLDTKTARLDTLSIAVKKQPRSFCAAYSQSTGRRIDWAVHWRRYWRRHKSLIHRRKTQRQFKRRRVRQEWGLIRGKLQQWLTRLRDAAVVALLITQQANAKATTLQTAASQRAYENGIKSHVELSSGNAQKVAESQNTLPKTWLQTTKLWLSQDIKPVHKKTQKVRKDTKCPQSVS